MANYPYLNDKSFLIDFDNENFKQQYVRITILDFQSERPIASIEGKSTAGSCNLSGTSNMRRTASCTLLVDPDGVKVEGYTNNQQYYDITEVQNLISMNKKVKMETGFINTLAYEFPTYANYDKIWFPLGVYVIKGASVSKGNNGISISLTLNDKCALLNGDMGGIIPAATVFSELEYIDENGDRIIKKLLIKDIIRYLVTDLGGQLPENVIISDIDDYIVKVMKWNLGAEGYLYTENNKVLTTIRRGSSPQDGEQKFTKGMDVGYISAPFIYPGTLECNAGETVASVLDKIKNTLGNFEWFFDLGGRFVFRRIRNYLNESIAKELLDLDEKDYIPMSLPSKSTYTFDDTNKHLVTSISKNPQYSNIKNDYVIWGSRKGVSGADLPIRYHLAFDNKPTVNKSNKRLALISTDIRGNRAIVPLTDNYFIGNTLPSTIENKDIFYLVGAAGSIPSVYKYDKSLNGFVQHPEYTVYYLVTDDWRTELYYRGLWDGNKTFSSHPYFAELNAEWPKIWDPIAVTEIGAWDSGKSGLTSLSDCFISHGLYATPGRGVYKTDFEVNGSDYWLDFLEGSQGGTESVSQYNVHNIGRRTKVANEKNVNCLVARTIPNYIYIETSQGTAAEEQRIAKNLGYETIQVSSEVFKGLSVGGSQNAAIDKMRELLYLYTQFNESISLSIIPIYHLEPNTRITVHDNDIGIHGDYLIKTISLPLTTNGTSSISATRCIDKTF